MISPLTAVQFENAVRDELEGQRKVIDGFKGRFEKHPREALMMCNNLFLAVAVLEVYTSALRTFQLGQNTVTEQADFQEELAKHAVSTSATMPDFMMQVGMKQARQDMALLLRRVLA
jgi:hypothetical protein